MWDRILANKKKIIAAILAIGLTIAGVSLSPEQESTIVDTAAGILPNAPAKTAP